MKKRKKALIIIAVFLAVPMVLLGGAVVYINIAYPHIHAELRLFGVISDMFVQFEDEEGLRSLSENMPSLPTRLSEGVSMEEVWIQTQDGDELKVLVMRPTEQTEAKNAVIWLHGGGYAMKSPEEEIAFMEKFVQRNGAVVVAPEYTLSVEAPYPAALNDAYDTLLWVKNSADTLRIDEEQIFVGGGSAGGGLTAALSLYARDMGEVNIAFQMPLYPMVDHTTVPSGETRDMLVWDLERNEVAWQLYLGELHGTQDIPAYASPIMAEDFADLPPTCTFVGTEDPFYEDTLEYVQKLQEGGVTVDCHVYEGAYHGFDMVVANAQITQEAWENVLSSYDYAVQNYRTPQP